MQLLPPSRKSPPPPSPVDGLPAELLTQIFLFGHRDDDAVKENGMVLKSGPDFEVLVSHVCHRWREVATRTPFLWTRLRFRLVSHLTRGQLYIERSRNQLLDILVDTATEDRHVPGITIFKDEFNPVFDVIAPQVHRWRSFVLKVRSTSCKAGARARLSTCGPAPNLETLELYHYQDWGNGQNLYLSTSKRPVCIFEAFLPKIRNISLIGVNLVWDECPFFSNLKSLEFALHIESVRPTYPQWERMLRASPELEKLGLHYSGPQVDSAWSCEPIVLERLEDLALTYLDSDYLCRLLRPLRMPRLRLLRLDAEEDQSSFIEFISDPATALLRSLQCIHISALECPAGMWRKLLLAIPQITGLEVNFGRVPEQFFQELFRVDYETEPEPEARGKDKDKDETTPPPAATPAPPTDTPALRPRVLLPNLKILKSTGLTGADIARFIAFRRSVGRPVRKFLVWRKDVDADTERIRAGDADLQYFRFEMDVFGHVDEDSDEEYADDDDGEDESTLEDE
ncbi:hypothetical protein GLOTRDRAFT_96609 [Gloeophyllum trabeum ATCC 11539]|uniref:Uncharacterized protein n=1 Tax=Gloeophyllum trabeum (strain ATCC 11539 / FP-39264 / Madison 617) TaxID=670483 RepID=S7RA83_GLOTA|nr:uncharacterized protein GLOTRDRAFT_96609 [Gloeophyllum trabeum ATCC 11539]EPQ51175.1 hypothetical protein GLOTRDRAFT_96609 [Gloeophyllum trabeum ATCC 11539]